MSTLAYKEKAVEEMKNFLERSGEEPDNFIVKVQVLEDILTVDLAYDDKSTTRHELSVALLAKTPEGLQLAYNKVIPFTEEEAEEDVMNAITNAFPTQEEIDEGRKKAEEEAARRKEFQEQMQNLDPQELAKMAANMVPPAEDGEEDDGLNEVSPETSEK